MPLLLSQLDRKCANYPTYHDFAHVCNGYKPSSCNNYKSGKIRLLSKDNRDKLNHLRYKERKRLSARRCRLATKKVSSNKNTSVIESRMLPKMVIEEDVYCIQVVLGDKDETIFELHINSFCTAHNM